MASRSGSQSVLLRHRQPVRLSAGKQRPDVVDRVSGVRLQRDVPRLQQPQRDVADALLRADERQRLGGRVQLHAKAAVVPPGDGLAELRQALGLRVAVVGAMVRSLLQLLQHGVGRRQVGVADAEGDDTLALGPLGRDAPGDLHEKIGRKLLDTLRELHCNPFDFSQFLCCHSPFPLRGKVRACPGAGRGWGSPRPAPYRCSCAEPAPYPDTGGIAQAQIENRAIMSNTRGG